MVNRLRQSALLGIPTAIVAYLVLVPVIFLLWSSVKPTGMPDEPGFTLDHYGAFVTNPRTYRLLSNTLIFAVGTTIITLLCSTALSWIIERTNVPFKTLFRALIIAPMASPALLLAMGWALLASPKIGFFNLLLMDLLRLEEPPFNIYSLLGMMFVLGLTLVPAAFLMISVAFKTMDPSFEEASMVSGKGYFTTLRRVQLPLLLPTVLGTAIYIFQISMVTFDIPGILGIPAGIVVFSSEIFFAAHPVEGATNFATVGALSATFFVGILVLSYLYVRQTRHAERYATITGKGYRPRVFDLRRWRYAAVGSLLGYVLLATVFPVLALLWSSLIPFYTPFAPSKLSMVSLQNYLDVAKRPDVMLAIPNTLIIAAVAAVAVVALSFIISWIAVRSKFRFRRLLDFLSFLPMALPHIMLGLALIFVYLTIKFIPIYGTIWIIVIAYVTSYIVYGSRLLNGAMFQINKELEEASQASGAALLRTFKTITVPLLTPALVGVVTWVLMHAMREFSAASMLYTRQSTVVSTLLWEAWSYGQVPVAAAIGIGLVVALLLIAVLGQALTRFVQRTLGT